MRPLEIVGDAFLNNAARSQVLLSPRFVLWHDDDYAYHDLMPAVIDERLRFNRSIPQMSNIGNSDYFK